MKYTPHTVGKLTDALANGEGRVRACKIAGISYQTFLDWLNGKPEFLEDIKKAEDQGNDRIKDLQKRKIIEDKSWQSGAWWLERNFPDEFGRRERIDHTNAGQPFDRVLIEIINPTKPVTSEDDISEDI